MGDLVVSQGIPLAFWSPGPAEMLLLAVVALLLYGGNLPEVARSWGKSFTEFRRGLTGIQNELNEAIYSEPDRLEYRDDTYSPEGFDDSVTDDDAMDDEVPSGVESPPNDDPVIPRSAEESP